MEKVKQYKTKDISGNSNMSMSFTDTKRTKVVFELNEKELSLISGDDYIKINDELTLELNKRLHQNKDVSINKHSKRKSKRYRFIVLDTDYLGLSVEPKHLNIDSNYNTFYDYDKEQFRQVDELWWLENDKTDDYDKDFKGLEVVESEMK